MSGEVEKCPILHVRPKFYVFTLNVKDFYQVHIVESSWSYSWTKYTLFNVLCWLWNIYAKHCITYLALTKLFPMLIWSQLVLTRILKGSGYWQPAVTRNSVAIDSRLSPANSLLPAGCHQRIRCWQPVKFMDDTLGLNKYNTDTEATYVKMYRTVCHLNWNY